MQPFRFAVQVSTAESATAWRDLARKVEDLGYSTLFIPDHFDNQFGPLVALTVAPKPPHGCESARSCSATTTDTLLF